MVERLPGGAQRQVRRQLAFGRQIALRDAGALPDPFVGGVDTRGQFFVADGIPGEVGAAADDMAADHGATTVAAAGAPFS